MDGEWMGGEWMDAEWMGGDLINVGVPHLGEETELGW